MKITERIESVEFRNKKDNRIIACFDYPEVNFSMDETNVNKKLIDILTGISQNTGATANEAGQALKKVISNNFSTVNISADDFVKIVDTFAKMGCTSFPVDDELRETTRTILQSSRGADHLRPETPAASETSNQNELFDFLEQNAYAETKDIFDGEDYEWITPLDTI